MFEYESDNTSDVFCDNSISLTPSVKLIDVCDIIIPKQKDFVFLSNKKSGIFCKVNCIIINAPFWTVFTNNTQGS